MAQAKRIHRIYWFSTILIVIWMYSGAIGALSNSEFMLAAIEKLDYPHYFHYLIGAAKIIGASLLIIPVHRLLRLFAYSGVLFELIAASLSYAISGYYGDAFIPLIIMGITIASLYTWWKKEGFTFRKNQ